MAGIDQPLAGERIKNGRTRETALGGEPALAALIIKRAVLRPVARQRPGQPASIGKVVTVIMKLDAVAMPGQPDIGSMAIKPWGGENMGTIDRAPPLGPYGWSCSGSPTSTTLAP